MSPAILLVVFAAPAAYSQTDIHGKLAAKIADPELRAMTQQVLREMNVDYEGVAKIGLAQKGETFDRARVEISGVMSNDDTYRFNTTDFDGQIKPSFSADAKKDLTDKVKSWFGRAKDPYTTRDINEMKQVMRGEMNARAKEAVAAYKGLEINEIVAHSWGSELIYAAILNGDMLPPKKLIVLGVPDNDFEKWKMLAARTGTEVHWARADNDAVALDKGVKIAKEAAGDVDFKAKWDAACMKFGKRICHAHNRPSKPLILEPVGNLAGFTGHGRAEYYDLMKRNKVINGTVLELRAAETARKEAEIRLVKKAALESALVEARGLVAQAREQVKISQRDHDQRLKNTYADLAQRSCAKPGSVTQAELDGLPKPYGTDVMSAMPRGLGACGGMVYSMLRHGASAEEIRVMSLPSGVPVDALVPPPPQAVQPVRQAPAAPVGARTPFSSTLPGLRELAVTACRSRGQVPIDKNLIQPPLPYSSWDEMDGRTADALSAGLGNCESRLFRRLIELIRAGQGDRVTAQWVQETAAAYRDAADAAPGVTRPQTGGGDPCRDHGNIRCP